MTTLAQRSIGYLVAGAIALGLIFYVFGKLDAYQGEQDRMITEASQAELRLVVAHNRERAKWRAIQERHERQLAERQRHTDTLLVGASPELQAAVAAERAECSVVIQTCKMRLASAELDISRLTARLTEQLTVRDHRWGVWVGVGIGTAGKPEAMIGLGRRLVRLPFLH